MTRTCEKCPRELGAKNKSGLCRSCLSKRINADPVTIEARRRGIAAHYAKPGAREAVAKRIMAYNANVPPEHVEMRREHGKRQHARYFAGADGYARLQSPEARRKRGASVSETRMAWCPPELREEYRDLVRRQRLPAAEARAIIEAQAVRNAERAAKAEADRLAAMTPLERQLERVAKGARVIKVHPFRKAGPEMTLGGVSAGML